MSSQPLSPPDLTPLATEVLETVEAIAETVRVDLADLRPPTSNALVNPDPFNSPGVLLRLQEGREEERRTLHRLAEEPVIARVRYLDEEDNEQTLFVCRGATPRRTPPGVVLASYRSPKGRLASLAVGEDAVVRLPKGEAWLEVVERALLRPVRAGAAWDCQDTVWQGPDRSQLTIRSLRALLARDDDPDILARLLAEEAADENISEGVVRRVLTRVSLRDQPVLDSFQDEIFRLPLDQQLLLLGPPGSGKTTTLIRRLGQKLDLAMLDEAERRRVAESPAGEAGHARSWLMFTPTSLLRQYLKEAFAREGVPASDQQIRTWDDHRRDLARRRFPILRTAAGRGGFVEESVSPLMDGPAGDWAALFSDFDGWRRDGYWRDMGVRARVLADDDDGDVAALGSRLAAITITASSSAVVAFLALADRAEDVRSLIEAESQSTRAMIDRILTQRANADRGFLDALAAFVADLGRDADDDGEDDEFAEDEEDDDFAPVSSGARARAAVAYRRAVIAQARAEALRRPLPVNGRHTRILEWLGDRGSPAVQRPQIARSAGLRAAARPFLDPLRPYLSGVAARYRRFRRLRRAEGVWFGADRTKDGMISELEIDVVLLASLRGARELLSDVRVRRRLDQRIFSPVAQFQTEVGRNQVMVDEATDFSAVQLACMEALTDAGIGSFFACGDFNQRVTAWGANSLDAVRWSVPNIEVREVARAYRQSPRLVAFASRLAALFGGESQAEPIGSGQDDPAPVLGLDRAGPQEAATWLAARIGEVVRRVGATGDLPTLAVLVNGEAAVAPLAEALDVALRSISIRARACPNGEVVGQDSDVRVFDVQHIKGLEFEAAFFLGVDRLARERPALFDKYLYVGATRAATFLGLTCEGAALPPALAELRGELAADWG